MESEGDSYVFPSLRITIPGSKNDNDVAIEDIEDDDDNDDDATTTTAAAADAPKSLWLQKAEAHEAIPRGRPAGFVQAPNHHHIEIDTEQVESSGVGFPTLETNYDDLRPLRPGEPQNLFTDMRRFSDHMDHINKRFYSYLRVPPERQTVIRDLKRLQEEAKELFEVLDESGVQRIPVGIDTEKELSTLQFSFFLRDHYGPGRGKGTV